MIDAPSGGVPGYLESSPFDAGGRNGGAQVQDGDASGVLQNPDGSVVGVGRKPYDETVLSCPRQKEAPRPGWCIRVSFFYDGTGNNRDNVGLGSDYNGDDSYSAGLSNIAKLESAGVVRKGPGMDRHFSVYTEGIGTANRSGDTSMDMGDGMGFTGVVAKVMLGIRECISNIKSIVDGSDEKERKIDIIHVDVFGFSRGAAAARYSIWRILNHPTDSMARELAELGFHVGKIKIMFVGLFDTVASYGIYHDNDTADLRLNSISVAEKVVQLAAAEEHRKNFRLTDIRSAGVNGKQIFLPGVHSDVGGGYADIEDEVDIQLIDIDTIWMNEACRNAVRREQEWLVNSGWYRADEIQESGFFNELKATRRGILNTYSRIPLKIMADFSRENGVHISEVLELEYPIPSALSTARDVLLRYARGNVSSESDWFHTDPGSDALWHKDLRHDYLHFSACYGTLVGKNEPQWSSDNPISGRRRRIIQEG